MLYFFIFLVFLIVFAIVFNRLTKSYKNPYTATLIFGKKGCGKSTYLTKLSLRYNKKGWSVYCTEDIVGTYKINPNDIGLFDMPRNSLVLVDEAGMLWDNRDYRNFKPAVGKWFRLIRHRGIKIIMFSQNFDVDKKIRDQCDDLFLLIKFGRVFSWAKKIDKVFVLNNSTAEAPSSIDENMSFVPFIFWPFGSRELIFIPKYAKYFDSFVADPLPIKDFKYRPLTDYTHLSKRHIRRLRKYLEK